MNAFYSIDTMHELATALQLLDAVLTKAEAACLDGPPEEHHLAMVRMTEQFIVRARWAVSTSQEHIVRGALRAAAHDRIACGQEFRDHMAIHRDLLDQHFPPKEVRQ